MTDPQDLAPLLGRDAGRVPLMLVSADTGPAIRQAIAAGLRPCPEYLRLEREHGVRLLSLPAAATTAGRNRSLPNVVRHVVAALREVRGVGCVLSDSEHVGIPLALGMLAARVRTPHVVLGHHLTTPPKPQLLRWTPATRRIDRLLVHSATQAALLTSRMGVPAPKVHLLPYGIDTAFWSPRTVPEEDLVVSAGREHRDYRSLALACADEPLRVSIADSSGFSPGAHRSEPDEWPPNVERSAATSTELRERYAAAKVVVVPVLPTDFQAGITTVLEAMSMGRAVVVTDTEHLRSVVRHGETGLVVPPGDVRGLRAAIRRLVADPLERRRLGQAARRSVQEQFSLDLYVGGLAAHLTAATEGHRT